MKIVPEIESLITFSDIWTSIGPIIITVGVLIISAIILLLIKKTINNRVAREIYGIVAMVVLVFITLASFQVTSYIWSL